MGSDIERFIRFSYDFGHSYVDDFPLFGRVPSMLIEDLLESQTIDSCLAVWSIVESFQDKITHIDFAKGYNNTSCCVIFLNTNMAYGAFR